MIEVKVKNYLEEKLEIPVRMEDDEDIDGKFILIEKTRGGQENYIKKATLAIQSFALSLFEAAMINEKVKETMGNIIELDDISRCQLNSDYNYTDTKQKRYRYQAVYDIIYF